MKKSKYLLVGDKIKEKGLVLTVIKTPVPMGKDSIYQVKCVKENGETATFVVGGNIKLEVING